MFALPAGSSSLVPSLGAKKILGLTLAVLMLGGCGGGDTYSFDEGEFAQRFLPTEREVSHHPDSLRALSIQEEDNKIQYELEGDYESLMRKWSCTYQTTGAGRSQRSLSYATLWSLELSLASLQPEAGILTLSKEQAWDFIEKRKESYRKTLQIDVYWFADTRGTTAIAGPGTDVELVVGKKRYRPERRERSPLREAFLGGGDNILYRRNTFYFPRIVDGEDILEGASGVELDVQRMAQQNVRFAWTWADESA